MDHLWAPWRMAYIKGEKKPEGCIFCEKPKANDDTSLILWRGEFCFIMLNAFPYNTGHLLVAPYQHTGDLLALSPEESAEVFQGLRLSIERLQIAFEPEGFNIGANLGQYAGAGFAEHVHFHVVPRWPGDTNFMAVTAQCRIVPEALQETYQKLKQAQEQGES